jgi:hypothetical protein
MKKLIAFLGILLLTISCSDNSPNDSLVMGEMNLMRNSGSGTLDEIVVTSRVKRVISLLKSKSLKLLEKV